MIQTYIHIRENKSALLSLEGGNVMRKKILTILLIVVMLLVITTGCGEKKEDLTGRWVKDTDIIELYSDGTGILTSMSDDGNKEETYSCTWIAENGRLKFTFDLGVLGTRSGAYDYTLSKSKLILTTDDGVIREYYKEE